MASSKRTARTKVRAVIKKAAFVRTKEADKKVVSDAKNDRRG